MSLCQTCDKILTDDEIYEYGNRCMFCIIVDNYERHGLSHEQAVRSAMYDLDECP